MAFFLYLRWCRETWRQEAWVSKPRRVIWTPFEMHICKQLILPADSISATGSIKDAVNDGWVCSWGFGFFAQLRQRLPWGDAKWLNAFQWEQPINVLLIRDSCEPNMRLSYLSIFRWEKIHSHQQDAAVGPGLKTHPSTWSGLTGLGVVLNKLQAPGWPLRGGAASRSESVLASGCV